MADIMRECLKKAKLDRVKQRRALAWLLVLSMLTSFGVMWQMHGVGEAQSVKYVCGLDEHTHMDSCYPSNIICSLEEGEGHTHTEDCYTQQEGIVCEVEAHTHDENCYSPVDELVCPLHETPGHTHVEECYGDITQYACASAEHTHADACYTVASTVQCGQAEIPAHHHSDSCYTTQKDLVCGQAETSAHQHGEGCYASQLSLTCTLAEDENHAHTDSCYTASQTLTCPLAQTEGHAHSDACYTTSQALTCAQEETEGHTHDASCTKEERMLICTVGEHTHTETCGATTSHGLICGLEEEESHTHTADCFQTNSALTCMLPEHDHVEECMGLVDQLICDKTEQEPHTHDDSCYAYGRLNCGLEHEHTAECYVKQALACGLEHEEHVADCYVDFAICGQIEHTHDAECTSNPEADLVTRSGWEASVPKSLTGVWSDDLLTVAASQLGFGESTQNFVIDENGQRQGYNRYGAFYSGSDEGAYGEWSAKFVAFCLHYAGVKGVSTNSGAYAWFVQLSNSGALAADAVMKPGDLVFLDCSGNGRVDRVAIVSDSDNATFVAVYEGDAPDGTVRWHAYALTGENAVSLMGIYHLPENPALAPMETTAPVVETTGADQETTAATEENTVPTEETTEATEETTEATEATEDESNGVLHAYVLSYDDYNVSLFAMPRARAMARDALQPNGPGITLGTNGTTISSVTVESQTYENGPWTTESGTSIGIDGKSALRFEVNYTVERGTLNSGNNHVTYQMPAGVTPIRAENGNVQNEAGDTVGIYTIDMNGKVDIIFNDTYVTSNATSAIDGFFRFKVSTKTLENNTQDDINFNFGQDLNIVVKDDIEKRLTLDKSTRLDMQSGTLKYTIRISSNKGTTGPVNLFDYLADGDKGSFQNIKITKNGSDVTNQCNWSGAESGGMSMTLPQLNAGEEYVVTYDMPINEMPADGKVTNKATVKSDGSEGDEKEITIPLPNDLKVDKTGKLEGRKITYTVTIDSPYGTDKNITVKDAFKNFNYIKDFDVSNVVVTTKTGSAQIISKENTDTGFTMELPKMNPGDRYTLTYTVDVDDIPGNNLYIQNTTDASTGLLYGRDDETTTIPQTSLKKTGMVEGDKIRWEIIVNQSKQNISGWTLKDYYNWAEYNVQGAIVSPAIIAEDGTPITEIDLPFTFPEGSNNTYTIIYYTDVVVGMRDPVNRAELTPGPGNPGESIGSGDVRPPDFQPPNPLEKTGEFKPAEEGADSATVDWLITIDRSMGDITAPWTFTESLSDRNKSWFTKAQATAATSSLKQQLMDAGISGDNIEITYTNYNWQSKTEGDLKDDFDQGTGDGRYIAFQVNVKADLAKAEGQKISVPVSSTVPMTVQGANGNAVEVRNQAKIKEVQADAKITYTPKQEEQNPGDPKPTLEKYLTRWYDPNRADGQIQWGLEMKIPNDECKGKGYTIVDVLPAGLDLVYLSMQASWIDPQQIIPGGGTTGTIPMIIWGAGPYNFDYRIEQTPDGRTQISLDVPQKFVDEVDSNNRRIYLTIGCDLNSVAGQDYGDVTVGPFINEAHLTKLGEEDKLVEVEAGHDPITVTKKMVYKSHTPGASDNTYQKDTIPYKVVVNPLGKDLLEGGNTLTLTDDLAFTPTQLLKDVNLVPGSVKLYQLNENGVRVRQLSVRDYSYTTQSSMDGSQAHRKIIFTVPDAMAIEVNYEYKLIGNEGSQVVINNTATLTGVSGNHNQDSETTTLKFQESSAGARIRGVSLIKVDADNAALVLTGAKFELHKWDANQGKYVLVTQDKNQNSLAEDVDGETRYPLKLKNGQIDLNDLDPNVAYKLVEIKAPDGYQLPENAEAGYEFVIDRGNTQDQKIPDYQINHLADGAIIRITNKRSDTGVTVFKISSEDGAFLADVVFELYKFDADSSSWEKVNTDKELKTGSLGRVYLDKIDPGIPYMLKEIAPADGYVLGGPFYFFAPTDAEPDKAEMNFTADGKTLTAQSTVSGKFYVENSPATSMNLKKVDEDQPSKVLAGAQFNIFEWNGSDYVQLNTTEIVTNENGIVDLKAYVTKKNVAYKLVETVAPMGYDLPDPAPSVEFYVESDDGPLTIDGHDLKAYKSGETIVMTNKGKANMTIRKVDANDVSITLPGAEFNLYKWNVETGKYEPVKDNNNKNIVLTTPAGESGSQQGKGEVHLKDILEYNVAYMLRETEAPSGYAKPDHDFEFLIRKSKDVPDADLSMPQSFRDTGGVILDNGGTMDVPNDADTKLTLHKQNSKSDSLSGAQFRLDWFGPTGFETIKEDLVTDKNGNVEIGSYVKEGEVYRLVETKAPVGYQKYPIPTYFKIDREWFAASDENIAALKEQYKDNAYATECLNGQHGSDMNYHVKIIRHWWPYSKAVPNDDATDVLMLCPDTWTNGDGQPVNDMEKGLTVTDYAIDNTEVSVTKYWNGGAEPKVNEVNFDLYRAEIPMNLTAGNGNVKLTIRDDEEFIDADGQTGAFFENISGYYPQGSEVTFRVYYTHANWPISDPNSYRPDSGDTRICQAYDGEVKLNPKEGVKGATYGDYLRYFTYTVRMDADKEILLKLDDNFIELKIPRWNADIQSVSLTESTASPIAGDNGGNSGGVSTGEQRTLHIWDEDFEGNGAVAFQNFNGSYADGTVVTFQVTYKHPDWGSDRVCRAYLDGAELAPREGAQGRVDGGLRIFTYSVTMNGDKSIKLNLHDNWDDAGVPRWEANVINVDESNVTAPPATGDDSGDSGSTTAPPAPTVVEGKPLQNLGGTFVGSHTIKYENGKWDTVKILNLPLTGYNAKGEPVYYSYYAKETTTGDFRTTYLNNGGVIAGTITIVNTPNDIPRLTLYKQTAEYNVTGEKSPLPGAEFKLIRLELNETDQTWKEAAEQDGKIYTTDATGSIDLSQIDQNATYILREVKAPKDYEIGDDPDYIFTFSVDNKPQHRTDSITLDSGEAKTRHILGNHYTVKIDNAKTKLKVNFLKVDGSNAPLQGARFSLTQLDESGNAVKSWTLTSDRSGKLIISHIEFQSDVVYRLVETMAPAGYQKSEEVFTFKIDSSLEKGSNPVSEEVPNIGQVQRIPSDHTFIAVNYKKDQPKTSISVEKQWKNADGSALKENLPDQIDYTVYQAAVCPDWGVGDGKIMLQVKDEYNDPSTTGSMDTLTGHFPAGTKVRFRLYYKGEWNSGFAPKPTTETSSAVSLIGGGEAERYFDYEATVNGDYMILGIFPEDNVNGNWSAEFLSATLPIGTSEETSQPEILGATVYTTGTITATEKWQETVADLPLSGEANGKTFYYTYYVVETPVNGYETSYETRDGTVVITNAKRPVYELPKTGSIGTLPFTLLGLTLMGAPIGYAADQHLRKRKSRKTK